MKKKILSLLLAVCMIMPCVFALNACTQTPPPEGPGPLTNSEKSVIYKEVAVSAWAEIGVDDPTVETSGNELMSVSIPDKKQETTDPSDLMLIKMNSNNMASVLYFIGLLYENSNFALTNGVVKFDGSAEISFGGTPVEYNYTFTLKPQLDIENNKVYLEAHTVANGTEEQYIVVDANYNFESKTMISFRTYTISGGMYCDLGITEDNKYKIYGTMDTTDTLAVAIDAEFNSFKTAVQNVSKLNTLFSEEIQEYMTINSKVMTELMG